MRAVLNVPQRSSVLQGRLLTAPGDKFDSLTLLYHLSWSSVLPLGMYSVTSRGARARAPRRCTNARESRARHSFSAPPPARPFPTCARLAWPQAVFEYRAVHDPLLTGPGAAHLWGLIFASGFVAFFLNLMNFLVTKYTSAITLQVLGNVKVVISIAISLLIFGNEVSGWSTAGCVITLAGVAAYNKAPKS
eukprot:4153588-Prymnesium_polylepis.1